MKMLSRGLQIFVIVGAVLFAAAQSASAAFTWYNWAGPSQSVGSLIENPPALFLQPGQDIVSAQYAADADYRFFRMDLKGTPSAGGNNYAPLYQFMISSTSGFRDLNTYSIPIPTPVPSLILASGVTPTSATTEWYFRNDNSTPNVLEWAIKKTDLPDTFAWQAFSWNTASVGGPITGLFDLTAAAVVTPIPSAALLLGTGLIGLIGLKRRSRRQA